MCGIAGMFRESGCNEASLVRMRDALIHRGPDDAGFWISSDRRAGLAQRRLSIIAPGPDGHQPISNEDGTIWLVFNGEIYNYADLRRQLERLGHRFRSRSDTETIVHAYEEWGENCASHLRGMFAFAIWDIARQRLVLGRDHTGIKPMFYYWDGRTFAFASEIKAFWQLDDMDREIDRSAVFDYLTYLYVPTPKTAYARVRKLAPGHWLRFEAGSLIEREYWDVPLQQDESLTDQTATDLVQQQLHDAIAANMVSDVPVGAFLSGGLDSSTVVSYMADLTTDPVRAFSIGFDVLEHSETEYARQAATAFGASYRERVVGRESIRTLLPRLCGIYDEPYSDGSAMPTLRVCELAREEVKVVLSGDGGDEVFAGYQWYERWLNQQRIARRIPRGWGHRATAAVGHAWPDDARGQRFKHFLQGMADDPFTQYARQMELLTPVEKRAVLRPDWAEEFAEYDDYWHLRRYWRSDLDPITRLQYVDLKTYLPDDILTKVDRAAMAVGLEVRPPLLDHLLIEAVFRVPSAIRFAGAEKKYLLKRAVAQRVPREIRERRKKGFSSPLMDWIARDVEWVHGYLTDSAKVVRPGALDGLGRHQWGPKCWSLLTLEQWARDETSL